MEAEPLLDGVDAARALDVVAEVAAALRPPGPPAGTLFGLSLARGAAGVSVFFAEAYGTTGDEAYLDAALHYLDVATDGAAEARLSPSLYSGTVGVGWLLTYLDGRVVETGDAADDVDAYVADALARGLPKVDLTDGLVGAGVYLLARLPRAQARAGLDRVVALLAAAADRTGGGASWFTGPAVMSPEELAEYPAGYRSLGLAHGSPGMVAFLARAHAAGVAGAGSLLADAVRGLVAFRDVAGENGRYPAVVPGHAPAAGGSRVAWCYGDPGVAVALLAAGYALRDAGVVAEGEATARAAARRSRESALVVDTGLCHGSAGLMHVFGRLAAATGDEACRDAACRWYGVLLGQRVSGAPVAGFQAILDIPTGLVPVAGLLEGAAGAGLALLSATRPGRALWDAVLLADPRDGVPAA